VTECDVQIAAVRGYDGDREKLGNAEQFYSHLLQVPSYRLRAELMLFRLLTYVGLWTDQVTNQCPIISRHYQKIEYRKLLQ